MTSDAGQGLDDVRAGIDLLDRDIVRLPGQRERLARRAELVKPDAV